MIKAFMFGKFLPFHKGHEAMIKFALRQCDFLSVLVCAGSKENIDAVTRSGWIIDCFAGVKNIEVDIYHYNEEELSSSSESSRKVSESWSVIFKNLYPDYSLLITSENYGDFVAEFMQIRHVAFDIPRELYPTSSSAVRNNLPANWSFLPDAVKRFYAIKVVILGTESTGKTTLAKRLAKHFLCSLVMEAGRDLIADSSNFRFEDLILVASEHARRIDMASHTDSPLIIIDTDIHITNSYGRFVFNRELPVNDEIYYANKAGLYIYLVNDVDYVQDGTRLAENERNLLDLSHRQVLLDHNIDFIEIGGSWEERFEKSVVQINKLLAVSSGI